MKYSRKRLTLEKESGETVVCRQGVVNTRQSGVFAALFTRLFFFFFFPQNVGGSVSLRSAHQVLVRHVGNVLARFMSAEGRRWWGWQSAVSSYVPFRTLRQGRSWRALNSDQLFKCEVRANSAVGFPRWMVKGIHFS